MKSSPCLSSQVAGVNQLSQERTAPIFGVVVALIQHVEGAHYRIQPDQVRRFQWTHFVAEAFFENAIDLAGRRYLVLQDKRRLVHEQVRNTVRYKTGQVLDNDSLFVQARK